MFTHSNRKIRHYNRNITEIGHNKRTVYLYAAKSSVYKRMTVSSLKWCEPPWFWGKQCVCHLHSEISITSVSAIGKVNDRRAGVNKNHGDGSSMCVKYDLDILHHWQTAPRYVSEEQLQLLGRQTSDVLLKKLENLRLWLSKHHFIHLNHPE